MIDSWAWIEYWKAGKSAKAAAKHIDGDEEAFVSAINLIEIYSWFSRYYDEDVAKARIETVEKRCFVLPLDRNLSMSAARLKVKHKLGIADSVVLAAAKSLGAGLVTGDPDFEKMEGVLFIG